MQSSDLFRFKDQAQRAAAPKHLRDVFDTLVCEWEENLSAEITNENNDLKISFALSVEHCPVCNEPSPESTRYHSHGNSFKECVRCQTLYRSPRLKPEAYERLLAQSQSVAQRIDKSVEDFESVVNRESSTLKDSLKLLQEHSQIGKLLEVGCRTGEFMELARQKGWDVIGVEPSEKSCEFLESKNFEYHCKFFDDGLFPINTFDAVYFRYVIINLTQPNDFIQAASNCLKPGGVMVFEDFNQGSWAFKIHQERHGSLIGRNSLLFLNKKSIEHLAQAHGLKVVHYETYNMDLHMADLLCRAFKLPYVHRYGEAFLPDTLRTLAQKTQIELLEDCFAELSNESQGGNYYRVVLEKM